MIVLVGVFIGLALICAFLSGVYAQKQNDTAGGWLYAGAIGLAFVAVMFAAFS